MPLEDILGLCIGVPALISLIVLLYIMCIKSVNTERKYKESRNKLNEIKFKYYESLIININYSNEILKERKERFKK